jgi:hypothetical protein
MFTEAKMMALASSVAALVVSATSVSAQSMSYANPRQIVGHGAALFPDTSLTDWRSYADQLAVVSVLSEEQLELDPEVQRAGEGYVTRSLRVRIEVSLWTAPGVSARSGEIRMHALGWILKRGELIEFGVHNAPRLVPGARYVIPLVYFDESSVYKLASGAVIPFPGDQLAAEDVRVWGQGATARELSGRPLADIAAALEAAPVDPVVENFRSLPPRERRRAYSEAHEPK